MAPPLTLTFVDHKKPPHVKREDPATCFICKPPKVFLNADLLLKHLRNVHNLNNK